MEERRQLEQIDRKRMRSTSTSKRCDMRLRSSVGSSDQSTSAAMDDAADSLLVWRNEKLKKKRRIEPGRTQWI
ncbi:hypothetical protein A2U01_0032318 [Trifolium medium]|uniref:Uncharacterized protein n=1 Tax=Trifolium medium TaxID=97028 RepID=A0A392PGK5_9FABA|nr:hypothetical protein [Trifolium medium]